MTSVTTDEAAGTKPRKAVVRHGLTMTCLLVLWAPAVATSALLSRFAKERFAGDHALTDGIPMLGWGIAALILLFVVRRVGYRRRDVLLCFVPLVNWVFTVRICWRVAGLPHRDWPLRTDAERVKGGSE